MRIEFFFSLQSRFYPHKKPPSLTTITEKPEPVAVPASVSSSQTPTPGDVKSADGEAASLRKMGGDSPLVQENEKFSRPV